MTKTNERNPFNSLRFSVLVGFSGDNHLGTQLSQGWFSITTVNDISIIDHNLYTEDVRSVTNPRNWYLESIWSDSQISSISLKIFNKDWKKIVLPYWPWTERKGDICWSVDLLYILFFFFDTSVTCCPSGTDTNDVLPFILSTRGVSKTERRTLIKSCVTKVTELLCF